MKKSYEQLLFLPHHVSVSHTPMPRSSRAAQFAPFAALTGYEQVLREQEQLAEAKEEPAFPFTEI